MSGGVVRSHPATVTISAASTAEQMLFCRTDVIEPPSLFASILFSGTDLRPKIRPVVRKKSNDVPTTRVTRLDTLTPVQMTNGRTGNGGRPA
jgi:hypothetical protein